MKEEKILEKDIQRFICEWLTKQGIFFWRSNNTPIFGKSGDGQWRYRSMSKYTPKGLPDMICLIGGTFIGLEVKRSKQARVKPEQIYIGGQIKENGGLYYVVTSLDEVQGILHLHFPNLKIL
jgi:hypothetical protein